LETQLCPGCGACIGEDEWFCPFCDCDIPAAFPEMDFCPHVVPLQENCNLCNKENEDRRSKRRKTAKRSKKR